MAENRSYFYGERCDLDQILQEAQYRWLRPLEICEILRSHQKFHLKQHPVNRPPGGSLFLFDRKALRYFRKDGHRWRKKKDGKTVKEAHEKLKVGSIDVLQCYYAHGEDNENFQRRSYWMLNGQLEHVVLVHYREVKESQRSSISSFLMEPRSETESPQSSSVPSFTPGSALARTIHASHASSVSTVKWNGQALSSEFNDVNSEFGLQVHPVGTLRHGRLSECDALPTLEAAGPLELSRNIPATMFAGRRDRWPESECLETNESGGLDRVIFITHTYNDNDAKANVNSTAPHPPSLGNHITIGHSCQAPAVSSPRDTELPKDHDLDLTRSEAQTISCQWSMASSGTQVDEKHNCRCADDDEIGGLKKLDSFGRWMDKEIGGDCDNSLMASDSGNYWTTVDTENDKEASSLSQHMRWDVDSLGPSLSQEQLFSIHDFAPDWAFTGVETKVLIVGAFLSSKITSGNLRWGCMFGEIEVTAEVVTDNVIKCLAPSHAPGRVPFYITCSNRLACSEVREFEFHAKPLLPPNNPRFNLEEEVHLQTRLVRLLFVNQEKKRLVCSSEECKGCKLKRKLHSTRKAGGKFWDSVHGAGGASEWDDRNSRNNLLKSLLEDILYEWLVDKVHEDNGVLNVLDNGGLGIIHLVSSLGYDWAVRAVVAAGISPNFRDAHGRTALHWAAYFGREETVITLVRLGASPCLVDDPTPAFPGGQTAADLAAKKGHKGLAGYLAEADLTSYLSSLTPNQNTADNVAARVATENAVHTGQVIAPSHSTAEEQFSLKGSLAAVRNSVHAAALLQDAFRALSFRHREMTKDETDVSEVSHDLVSLGCLKKVRNLSNFEDYLHCPAVKIQQQYRGWKGRKEFLKVRSHIVKIQAHVRRHQARKQYVKVVWSVGIVEKAILRWRRKGAGLRGFRVKDSIINEAQEAANPDEYEFLRVGRKQKAAGVEKALDRVKSMVRQPQARDQYMRLVSKFENLKIEGERDT